MYIHGSFLTQQRAVVTVYIVTDYSRADEIEISPESARLKFPADSPVEITSEVNDTFDHLLRQSATIRLLASEYIADFFCASARDAVVNIYKDGVCLFAGFIEPQSYSQPYNERWDELEINCIDALSALQYSKYRGIGGLGISYEEVKHNAQQRTFYSVMTEILNGITDGIDITGTGTVRYLFDGSKAVDSTSGSHYSIFKQLSISELLFLGGEEDDVWQQDEVLAEMLRYLNLHIIQDGFTFYIFDWGTVKSEAPIQWRNITNGQVATNARRSIAISNDNAADCGTKISIGEVYNQLLLTCKTVETENVIESPLDDDLLEPVFDNKQKYCTEYSADGDGKTAYNAFYNMCHGMYTNYGGGRITDWFVRVMRNEQWRFPKNGDQSVDLITYFCTDKVNQQQLPNWLGKNPGAAIVSAGNVEINTAKDDNSPVSKVSMTNYLVVSVNGNGKDGEGECYPNDGDLKANIPYAVYTGDVSGGNFSPADEAITNYIVLSGKIALNPLMEMTAPYKELNAAGEDVWYTGFPVGYRGKVVPSRDNSNGRYYTRRYWRAVNPNDNATWDEDTIDGLVPFTGKGPEQYEFKYSAVGESSDTISKVSVLACMLVIGDKCVVESGTQGQISDFEWKTYKTREQCGSDDEYYQQCFYVGFNPKIGDKLIGTEFDMQNNISYTLGIDAEGIAIPVRMSDAVSGQVRFQILGPVNTLWSEITRRHPTFFRHTSWGKNKIPLLAHVSNIVVKQFEIKVYSDNGLIDSTGDNDIIYMSDTRKEFTNKKDDIEFKINSALSLEECRALDVVNTTNLSTPLNAKTKAGVLSIYDYNRGIQVKPEQLYVDSYYTEYHLPRVLMEQKLTDRNDIVGLFNHYTHPALGKTFFVQGMSRNLMEGTADLVLKETGE